MVPLDKIRSDLKEIRYYYSRKAMFDECKNIVIGSSIMEKVRRYNEAVKTAPPRRFLVYRFAVKQFFDLSDRNAHFPRQYRRRKFVLLHKGLQQFCFDFHFPRSRFLVGSFLPPLISTKTG